MNVRQRSQAYWVRRRHTAQPVMMTTSFTFTRRRDGTPRLRLRQARKLIRVMQRLKAGRDWVQALIGGTNDRR